MRRVSQEKHLFSPGRVNADAIMVQDSARLLHPLTSQGHRRRAKTLPWQPPTLVNVGVSKNRGKQSAAWHLNRHLNLSATPPPLFCCWLSTVCPCHSHYVAPSANMTLIRSTFLHVLAAKLSSRCVWSALYPLCSALTYEWTKQQNTTSSGLLEGLS